MLSRRLCGREGSETGRESMAHPRTKRAGRCHRPLKCTSRYFSSNRSSRHGILPLNSGICAAGRRPIASASIGLPVNTNAVQPAQRCANTSPSSLIQPNQLLLLADAFAVGRVAQDHARRSLRRPEVAHVALVEAQQVADAGGAGVVDGERHRVAAHVRAEDRRRQRPAARRAAPRRAAPSTAARRNPSSPGSRSACASGPAAGAAPSTPPRWAATPEPHSGSTKGVSGFQPVSRTSAAASASLSGALVRIGR